MRNLEQEDEDSFKRQFGKYIKLGVNADAVSFVHLIYFRLNKLLCFKTLKEQCRIQTKLKAMINLDNLLLQTVHRSLFCCHNV